MTASRLMMRQLSVFSRVPVYNLRSGKITDSDWEKVVIGIEKLSQANLFISDNTQWTTTTMRADLARLVDEAGIQWFGIDYIGKLQDRSGKDDVERTKYLSNMVHNFCIDFNLAGIANSSMNKEGMSSSKPRLANLSGSGQLGFDTDNAAFMIEGDAENLVRIYWEKQREGVGKKPFMVLYAVPEFPLFEAYTPGEGRLPYKD